MRYLYCLPKYILLLALLLPANGAWSAAPAATPRPGSATGLLAGLHPNVHDLVAAKIERGVLVPCLSCGTRLALWAAGGNTVPYKIMDATLLLSNKKLYDMGPAQPATIPAIMAKTRLFAQKAVAICDIVQAKPLICAFINGMTGDSLARLANNRGYKWLSIIGSWASMAVYLHGLIAPHLSENPKLFKAKHQAIIDGIALLSIPYELATPRPLASSLMSTIEKCRTWHSWVRWLYENA